MIEDVEVLSYLENLPTHCDAADRDDCIAPFHLFRFSSNPVSVQLSMTELIVIHANFRKLQEAVLNLRPHIRNWTNWGPFAKKRCQYRRESVNHVVETVSEG